MKAFIHQKLMLRTYMLCKGAWKIILTIDSRYCELQNLCNSRQNRPAILQLMIARLKARFEGSNIDRSFFIRNSS